MNIISEGLRYIRDIYKAWKSLPVHSKRELARYPIVQRFYILSALSFKPISLISVTDTDITIQRGGNEERIPINDVDRVEEDNDPILGLVYKIYTTTSSYLPIQVVKNHNDLVRLRANLSK